MSIKCKTLYYNYTHLNCLTVIVQLGHLAIIHLLLFIYLLSANHDHELFLDYGYNKIIFVASDIKVVVPTNRIGSAHVF